MSDIAQPGSVVVVQRRQHGSAQGGGRDPGPPAKKVVETYQEIDRAKPTEDRITILGIPAEQITPATHAALASLIGEINFLRSMVQRLERAAAGGAPRPATDRAFDGLSAAASAPLSEHIIRVLVLGYLNTFEDVRRSSGLLAAKGLLADVFSRFAAVEVLLVPPATSTVVAAQAVAPLPLAADASGLVGGAGMAAVYSVTREALDETAMAQQVRDAALTEAYVVSGVEMTVSLTVGAVAMGRDEGLVTALGRVDHLVRGSGY